MKAGVAVKRFVVGSPKSSEDLAETLLPKVLALSIFSSDALSSVAYASQEILLVLGAAGTVALANVVPISVAVATLLIIVVASYRQTVKAYPNGGGAYIVAHENLGRYRPRCCISPVDRLCPYGGGGNSGRSRRNSVCCTSVGLVQNC